MSGAHGRILINCWKLGSCTSTQRITHMHISHMCTYPHEVVHALMYLCAYTSDDCACAGFRVQDGRIDLTVPAENDVPRLS